ncbi:MAG: DUF3604 domain-containing protein [Armatimonadetes bacterium]|nr:DUF3604 domain-containing protein [Armatimonadota bacterium]
MTTTPSATVTIDPPTAMAGVRDTWRVTITGVEAPPGAIVRLQLGGGRDNKSDWTRPQVIDSAADEYATASCSGDATLQVLAPPFEEVADIVLDMVVQDAPLNADDEIVVVIGDTSGGGDGSTPQTFSQTDKRFKVFVCDDPRDGDRPAFRHVGDGSMDVTGAPMDRLCVFAPATVPAGQEFSVTIKAEDGHGNVAWGFAGALSFQITDRHVDEEERARREEEERREEMEEQANEEGAESEESAQRDDVPPPVSELASCPERIEFPASAGGVITVEGFRAFSRGLIRVIVTSEMSGVRYASNPVLITRHGEPQLYFGVIHGHTRHSDGIGSAEDYYACMRDHNRLDFGAISDHDHDYETTDEDWEVIQRVTAEANQSGRFVTLLGYEWAKWRRNGDGDRNVYYDSDYLPMYRSGDEHYPTPADLFGALREHRCIVIPHHPASTGNWCDYKDHDPEKERLVEIYSIWGSSERSVHDGNPYPMRYPRCPRTGFCDVPLDAGEKPEGFVQRALAMGRRLGFTGGGDDHDGHPGDPIATGAEPFRHRDGLMAVWAPELTRAAIFQAMYDRRTYATTGARIIALFSVGEAPMGGELSVADHPDLAHARTVTAYIVGQTRLAEVEVIRNNETVHRVFGDGSELELEWTDTDPLEEIALTPVDEGEPRFVFYYLRVLQSDGEMAWVSPVWIELAE